MSYLPPIAGILFIILMLVTFHFFDRLIKVYYQRFNAEWKENGSPNGFFWFPKESASGFRVTPKLSSTRARTAHFFSWLFRAPQWINDDPRANADIFKMRLFLTAALISLVLSVILFLTEIK